MNGKKVTLVFSPVVFSKEPRWISFVTSRSEPKLRVFLFSSRISGEVSTTVSASNISPFLSSRGLSEKCRGYFRVTQELLLPPSRTLSTYTEKRGTSIPFMVLLYRSVCVPISADFPG